MRQLFVSALRASSDGSHTVYTNPLCYFDDWILTEAYGTGLVGAAGTFRNLTIRLASAPGAGAGHAFTLLKNGADTGITGTIENSDTELVVTGIDVHYDADDTISLRRVLTGSNVAIPIESCFAIEFESDDDNTSIYGHNQQGSTSFTTYMGVFRGIPALYAQTTPTGIENVVSAPGLLTRFAISLVVAPGAGNAWTDVVMLNGVAQDGTGGTPDTSVTVADTDTFGSASFALRLAPDDEIYIRRTASGSVAAGSNPSRAFVFVADVDGESQFCGVTGDPTSGSVEYISPSGGAHLWGGVESVKEVDAGFSDFSLYGFYLHLTTGTPGAGKSITFTARLSRATPSGAPTITIADSETSGSDTTGRLTVAATNTIDLSDTPTGSPSAVTTSWAFTMYVAPVQTEDFALSRTRDLALAWVEFYYEDEAGVDQVYVWSGIALVDPVSYYYGYKDARLMLISDLVYALSDRFGRMQATRASFTLSDLPDSTGLRTIASFFSRISGRVVRNVEVVIRLISDYGRRRFWTPLVAFRGLVERAESADRYAIRFECVSWIARRLQNPVWTRLLGDDFPDAPSSVRATLAPVAIGTLSDEGADLTAPVWSIDDAGTGFLAGTGTHDQATQQAGGVDFVEAGFGQIAGVDPAIDLTLTENAAAGNLLLGVAPNDEYFVCVTTVTGGVESDPYPFWDFDTKTLVITGDNAAITASCSAVAGVDSYRFYIGTRGSAQLNWSHYLESASPSVQFTTLNDTPLPTPSDITPGGVQVTSIWKWCRLLAVAAGSEGPIGETMLLIKTYFPNRRPARASWSPVSGADEYHLYVGTKSAALDLGDTFSLRWVIPASQVNGNSDPYFELDVLDQSAAEAVTGYDAQNHGVIPAIYVGPMTSLTGQAWEAFYLHRYAGTEVIGLYVDGVRIDASTYGVMTLIPRETGYSTEFGSDPFYTAASGERHTLVFLRGTVAQAIIDGDSVLTANLTGVETIGDGSGTALTDLVDELAWLADNHLLNTAPAGDWVTSIPTFTDGTPIRRASSFTVANANAAVVLPGASAGARYYAQPITVAALLADIAVPAKALMGVGTDGQFLVAVLNPDAAVDATIRERDEVIDGSFGWQESVQSFANALGYQARPVYSSTGAIASYRASATVEHLTSQARHGDERAVDSTVLTLNWIQSSGAAKQIATAFVNDSAYLPRTVSLTGVLNLFVRSLGDILGVVHREAPAAYGWTEAAPRKHALLGMRLAVPQNTVQFTCLDLRTHVGDLSAFILEYLMSYKPLGGSLETPCIEDTDVGSPALVAPPDWVIAVVNWDKIPGPSATEPWELVFDVSVKYVPGSPGGSPAPTIQPALYLSTEDQSDTPVATGTATSSAIRERQQIVVDRPAGGGVVSYRALPILANGAIPSEAYMEGWLRARVVGSES